MKQIICREGWQPETFALAQEFFDRPRPHVPNCLVVNISPRDLSGLELQKRIVDRTNAETPIIFIADHGDVPTSVQAMKAGAVEFLIKPFTDDALFDAIREALKRSSIALGREAEMRSVRDSYASLSHRERQVMALVLSGLLNKQIGSELGISEITVKAHRGRVMQKMGAKSVVDLVRMATRLRSERALAGAGQSQVTVTFSNLRLARSQDEQGQLPLVDLRSRRQAEGHNRLASRALRRLLIHGRARRTRSPDWCLSDRKSGRSHSADLPRGFMQHSTIRRTAHTKVLATPSSNGFASSLLA